jgi:LmbE family N-acetylglucosaminyl deacetylase
MQWIYLSPHLDDVALSCGGLVWEQTHTGDQVQIWTICAGDPPDGPLSTFAQSLHERWQSGRDAIAIRRAEDLRSCAYLSASARHFAIPDCIYRQIQTADGNEQSKYVYTSEESLFSTVHPAEETLIDKISLQLRETLPEHITVVCPLSLGGHVDHRLVRRAAERLGRELYYYADYPYMLESAAEIDQLLSSGWRNLHHPISIAGLRAWQQAVAAHKSQISTFWADEKDMKSAIRSDLKRMGGIFMWKKPTT